MANNKKKTLLEEGTVRRFMKLAELAPLANSFLDGYHTLEEQEPPEVEEDELELDLGLDMEGEEEGDLEADLEGDLEADLDVEAGAEAPQAEEIIMAMASKLKDVAEEFGVDVELEGDVEPVELEAPDMGEEEELSLEPGEEELDVDVIDEDALVNEIARRVTQRLLINKNK